MKNNHIACVEMLLNSGAGINLSAENGTTALHMAAEQGYIQCTMLLLRFQANGLAKDSSGGMVLHTAASKGRAACVELLLKSMPEGCIHLRNDDGYAPIHLAAKKNHAACLEVLHKANADINEAASDGLSPLHLAARKCTASVKQLLQLGADASAVTSDGRTAAQLAIEAGHAGCLKQLLQKQYLPADGIDAHDNNGRTLLHLAAQKGKPSCVRVLLDADASAEVTDDNGALPVHLAAQEGSEACVELLLPKMPEGAINSADNDGYKPLHRWARLTEHFVRSFLSCEASVSSDTPPKTP